MSTLLVRQTLLHAGERWKTLLARHLDQSGLTSMDCKTVTIMITKSRTESMSKSKSNWTDWIFRHFKQRTVMFIRALDGRY